MWSSRCATLLSGVRAGGISNDMTSYKRRRHTPDQIIRKLAEGNKLLGSGQELNEVCRRRAADLPQEAPDLEPDPQALGHFLGAHVDQRLRPESLEVRGIAAVERLRVGAADQLEHDLVPVFA